MMETNKKKKEPIFDGEFWKYLRLPLFLMFLICLFPLIFTQFSIVKFTCTGEIGDTIGGIMSPFVAMVAVWVTYIAFWIQYKANIQQRQDIAKERFERNVFEMLNAQEQITSGLVLEKLITTKMKQTGRDTFQMIYEGDSKLNDSKKGDSKQDNSEKPLKDLLQEDNELKYHLSDYKHLCFLDHYFRHLYRIYKYIDEYDEEVITPEIKIEYAEIVRSHLSPYELVMLFYNSFSYDKSKNLIVKYNVLENIRTNLLATKEDEIIVDGMIRKI